MAADAKSNQPNSMISSGSRFQSPPKRKGKRCAPRKALRNPSTSWFPPSGPIESTPWIDPMMIHVRAPRVMSLTTARCCHFS
eukprot:3635868-Pyramimonas_sp.AAC.1